MIDKPLSQDLGSCFLQNWKEAVPAQLFPHVLPFLFPDNQNMHDSQETYLRCVVWEMPRKIWCSSNAMMVKMDTGPSRGWLNLGLQIADDNPRVCK